MAYYCGNDQGQECGMEHKTLHECLQECNRLEAHFGERFEPYDAGTREPVEVIREEP
jgi:hypothetical protein